MEPSYQDDWTRVYIADAIEGLTALPEKSVSMCVTSPPYWGLRSYLAADDEHKSREIGAEATPEKYVENIVGVMRGVWRVLRDDGTLWLNLGDSYNSGSSGGLGGSTLGGGQLNQEQSNRHGRGFVSNLKPKDLCMIPAHVALALQADGWYVRQELIWAKDSAMPESVTDRCTRSHEMLYMLTKKPRYFYDKEAIAEPSVATHGSGNGFKRPQQLSRGNDEHWNPVEGGTRNARSVWHINPRPYSGSHYATFPPELPMRCIRAGTSEKGVCAECGAPWRRVVERTEQAAAGHKRSYFDRGKTGERDGGDRTQPGDRFEARTVGWEPTCEHGSGTVPATVLDPCAGSGTTLLAARKLGRESVGIDLDTRNLDRIRQRLGSQGVLL